MPTEHLLFVYGSLMRGFQHHGVLGGAKYLGKAKTEPRWELLDLGRFPAVVAGTHRVQGEVYVVDDERLAGLDRLEGCPHFYRRVRVSLADGREAFIYQLQPSAMPTEPEVIPEACWRQWCEAQMR